MIFRVCGECPGCSSPVLFRIAVSGEAEQSFAAACPHCEATLHGLLRTQPDQGEITGFDIDGSPANLLEEPDGVAVVNVGTDLLSNPAPQSMVDPDGSPFLMHVSALGHDAFLNWRSRTARFFGVVDAYWTSIARWWAYYTAGNWKLFDTHARKYWSDEFPVDPEPIQRHDVIHRALELIFLHVAGVEYVELNRLVRGDFPGEHPDDAFSLARTLQEDGTLLSAQVQLFEVLDEFVQKRAEWRPGTLALAYDEAGVDRDSSLRIQRDDFVSLRALYLSCFERSYRFVDIPMALRNVMDPGDQTHFPDGSPLSLRKLSRLKVHQKEELLGHYDWGELFLGLFDRRLRNAVGHADTQHNVRTGRILSTEGEWDYVDFVRSAARSSQAPLFLLTIVKLLRVASDLDQA